MSDMSGDGGPLDANRDAMSTRASIEDLETDERPSPEVLVAAPVLDAWATYLDLRGVPQCRGTVSGHPLFADGALIEVGRVLSVGSDRSWLRAAGGFYRLGEQRRMPPILEAVMAPDWNSALLGLIGLAGLPEDVKILAVTLDCRSASISWSERRSGAAAIGRTCFDAGRHDLAAAFGVLATDVSVKLQCRRVAAELKKAIGGLNVHALDRILRGWRRLAEGCPNIDADPVRAARQAGDVQPTWTPILEAITAADWESALDHLLEMPAWPKTARQIALGLQQTESMSWGDRRVVAGKLCRLLGEERPDLADAFAVLAADVNSPADCSRMVELIENSIAGHELAALDRVLKGWRLLDGACPNVDPDPISAPRSLTAEHRLSSIVPKGAVIVRTQDYADECREAMSEGVVVVAKVGGVHDSSVKDAFKPIMGRVPLYPVPDIAAARNELVREFPHAESLIGIMLSDLPGRTAIKFRNTLLVGPAGCGKSRFARRLGEALGIHVGSYDGAGAGDAAFGGTGRRWSSGEPCWPLHVIRSCGYANPLILVDEIDKAGTSRTNGSLYSSILTLIERETASRFPDPYIQEPVDVSHVSYILTANDDTVLPPMLRDRCRILRMPPIRPEHVPAIARGIVADLVRERGLDARWVEQLDGDEIEIAGRMLGDGSIRRLRAVVERLLAARETTAPRN
jgi:ATPase family associated with various cellular activities (AAA)